MENGREARKDNDLFFTCALIDYIARKTKNTRADVVNALGKKRLEKIYDLADIYHSDNIDRVSEDFIKEARLNREILIMSENVSMQFLHTGILEKSINALLNKFQKKRK